MKMPIDDCRIYLCDLLSYKWSGDQSTLFRGYIYLNDELLTEDELIQILSKVDSLPSFAEIVREFDGFFSIVLKRNGEILIAVDRVRSMPLFYKLDSSTKEFLISDCIDARFAYGEKLNDSTVKEFQKALFTLGESTLYTNIKQVESGCCMSLSEGHPDTIRYYTYAYRHPAVKDQHDAIDVVLDTYETTFSRLAQYIGDRTAVIPLSGGHDSRLIAFYLKKNGCKVKAYTYGLKDNLESCLSKQVADALGIEWRFIEYNPKAMHALYKREFEQFALFASNGCSVPPLQEWYALHELRKEKYITDDCLIVPGFSGDFLAGSKLLSETASQIKKSELIRKIFGMHFYEEGRLNKEEQQYIEDAIYHACPYLAQANDVLSNEMAQMLFERFNLQERQAKYIENALRIYDYYNLKWATPFFDKKQFEVWTSVYVQMRCGRKLLFEAEKKLYANCLLKNIPFTSQIRKHNSLVYSAFEAVFLGPQRLHYTFGYLDVERQLIVDLLHMKTRKVKFAEWYISRDYMKLIHNKTFDFERNYTVDKQ